MPRIFKSTPLLCCLILGIEFNAQVFFTESFEDDNGWTLSNTFDNGNNKYVKCDLATNFPGASFVLDGYDGDKVIGMENTDADEIGAPEDGIVTINFDPIDIQGKTDIQCVITLAVNTEDQAYDDRFFANGDFLDIEIKVDGGTWVNAGSFCPLGESDNNSGFYQDANQNGNGGDIGEIEVTNTMQDYVFSINDTGSFMELRIKARMDEGDEELFFDNVRLRENTLDDVAPTVHSIDLLGDQVLQVNFNEPMSSTASIAAFYSGISGLGNVELSGDGMIATLTYNNPFDIGVENNLIIFGLSDEAGNAMSTAYQHIFYYNPNYPDLVISEIMYNDPTPADSLEYIEVYNNGATPIQLGGLRLADAVSFTFPTYELAAGDFYLIARRPEPANAFYGQNFANYGGSLSNGGETIIIYNTLGGIVDFVEYNNNLPWPHEGDGTGSSIELYNLSADNTEPYNWVGATNGIGIVNDEAVYGTPGESPSSTLPVVQFNNDDIYINENDGEVIIVMDVHAPADVFASYELNVIHGTTDNSDFTIANTSINLTENFSGQTYTIITITDDTEVEGVEYFQIQITNTANCTTGLNTVVDVIINDDDFVAPTLYINELMSSNSSFITDDAGGYDDWFEIYNPNSFPVDIAGYYVTDNALNMTKDRVPVGSTETIIEPMSWLLCWADEDGNQGPLHFNFRLSSLGEYLALVAPDGITVVDSKQFGPLEVDKSYGRSSDGNSEWVVFADPTPNATNNTDNIEEIQLENVSVFPNPAENSINFGEPLSGVVFNITGKVVSTFVNVKNIDCSNWTSGLYLINWSDVRFAPTKIMKK